MQPTYENIRDTLLHDTLGRNKLLAKFITMLNSIDENCSIAIDGAWGSGKTFFVKQAKLFLDATNEFTSSANYIPTDDIHDIQTSLSENIIDTINSKLHIAVYYDAWENDNDTDPILSLVYSIAHSIDNPPDASESYDNDLSQTCSTLSGAAFIASDICPPTSSLKPSFRIGAQLINILGSLITAIKSLSQTSDILDPISPVKKVQAIVNNFIDNLFPEHGNRLVVFIDELDRCRPSYAVELLERIKHYFVHDNVTFVFSTNISELQHTVKSVYGSEFNACRYLDRFFTYRINLPPIDSYIYIRSLSLGFCKSRKSIILKIINYFQLQPREINHFMNLFEIATKQSQYPIEHSIFYEKTPYLLVPTYILPVMLGLYIKDINAYYKFISGYNPDPLIDFLSSNYCGDLTLFLNTDEYLETDDPMNNVSNNNSEHRSKKPVDFSKRISDIYYSVFSNRKPFKIQDIVFDSSIKDDLLLTMSFLAPSSDYSFNEQQDSENNN